MALSRAGLGLAAGVAVMAVMAVMAVVPALASADVVTKRFGRETAFIQIVESCWFDAKRADVPASCHGFLDAAATVLREHPELLRIAVEGHASATGDAATPMDRFNLSLRRAFAVRDALIARGVARARLTLIAYGSDQPLAGGTAAAAQVKNRRVMFKLLEVQRD
jgi:outer membrane protein OmpA-like peptidoglycan-associated protein